jgi:hypothetical protein
LNEILESQRSPNDKLGLGYKKEGTHAEASTSKKHEWNTRRNSMMRTSYSMTRRMNEGKETYLKRWKLRAQVLRSRDTFRSG